MWNFCARNKRKREKESIEAEDPRPLVIWRCWLNWIISSVRRRAGRGSMDILHVLSSWYRTPESSLTIQVIYRYTWIVIQYMYPWSITRTITCCPFCRGRLGYPNIQPMLLQTNNTTAVETYRMPPSIDFAMRVVAFILFLITMNAIVDALELRQRHAKKYQEQNERAGHFRRTSRV